MILEINNTTKQKINTKILQQVADLFGQPRRRILYVSKLSTTTDYLTPDLAKFYLRGKKMDVDNKEVSLAFVSGSDIKKLNKQYRNKNQETDILSFIGDDENFLGEIIICYSKIKEQSKERKVSIKEELVFIFIHGLLHLLGYDDQTKKGHDEMMKLGNKLCKSILGSDL